MIFNAHVLKATYSHSPSSFPEETTCPIMKVQSRTLPSKTNGHMKLPRDAKYMILTPNIPCCWMRSNDSRVTRQSRRGNSNHMRHINLITRWICVLSHSHSQTTFLKLQWFESWNVNLLPHSFVPETLTTAPKVLVLASFIFLVSPKESPYKKCYKRWHILKCYLRKEQNIKDLFEFPYKKLI